MEKSNELLMKVRQHIYYILIGVASFVALVFIPMLGSDVDGGLALPKGTRAWVVFLTLRLTISVINVFIYASFINQGKLNILQDENYKKANQLLNKIKKNREHQPRSPRKFNAKEYGRKGVMIFITSGMALVALEQAILKFNMASLLTYAVTVISSILFGIYEMKKVEIYWTTEYLEYAEREVALEEEENNGRETIFESAGTSSKEQA